MTSYPIRLQTGSILAISKALETLESARSDALDTLLAGLDPDEYRAFMDGRTRLAKAAETIVHADRASRRTVPFPAFDRDTRSITGVDLTPLVIPALTPSTIVRVDKSANA
jgi:hypothetical protein